MTATHRQVRFETATNLLLLGDGLDPLAKLSVSYAFAQVVNMISDDQHW
jgi:hypothetical protein